MNKSRKQKVNVMLSLFIAVSIGSSLAVMSNNSQQNVYAAEKIEGNFAKTSKVIYEDISIVNPNNYEEIADSLNEATNGVTEVIIELNNSYTEELNRPTDPNISMAEVKEIIREQRANVKAYYKESNQRMADALELESYYDNYRIDSYAPFIFAEIEGSVEKSDVQNIDKLAQSNQISTIYIKSIERTVNPEINNAVNAIYGTTTVSNPAVDGSGVVIGILDTGIIDSNNPNFEGTSITRRTEWWFNETVREHSTAVASVAGGVYGLAPGATILSVEVSGEPSGEIEWMLDRDVNIINMSYYMGTNYGNYTSDSAYCDHIARNNYVMFVGSSGNRGKDDALVTSPNGYNMLTIGSCGNNGVVSQFSSWKENFNINFPNLVAPGEDYYIPNMGSGLWSGTSFSAPLTSGSLALLMQRTPIYATYPEVVMALVMATTTRRDEYSSMAGFHDQAGAGMLNLEKMMNSRHNTVPFTVTEDAVKTFVSEKTIRLYAGQRLQVAFVSLVNNQKNVNTNNVTDYDLYLYNSSDEPVVASVGTHNNEYIDYTVTTSGYYTIKIRQFSAKKTTLMDCCAYAYSIS